MSITIATGIDRMNEDLKVQIENVLNLKTKIVGYREYLLKDCYNTVIITEHLPGSTNINKLLLSLKKNKKRIILLMDSNNNPLFYTALKFGIYDILFDESIKEGIKVEDVINLIKSPKEIKDYAKIFEVMGNINDIPETTPIEDIKVNVPKVIVKEVEKIVEIEKVKEIPLYIPFKKKVLTVWGNAEFACELSQYIANNTEHNILLIDLDFTTLKIDYCLNLQNKINNSMNCYISFKNILESLSESSITKEVFIKNCIIKSPNFYVLVSDYYSENYETLKIYSINKLLDFAYHNFDITIVNINSSIRDHYAIEALRYSQHNLIPVQANILTLVEYLRYIDILEKQHRIPRDKQCFIAYQYKKGIDMDSLELKSLLNTNYYINITYNEDREHQRSNGYRKKLKLSEKNIQEYKKLLIKLDIATKPSIWEKIKSKTKKTD
jgi:cellulose biosynthesis protein BcsQ